MTIRKEKALRFCCSCKKACNEEGIWDNMNPIPADTKISYGLCLDCGETIYKTLSEIKRLLSIAKG